MEQIRIDMDLLNGRVMTLAESACSASATLSDEEEEHVEWGRGTWHGGRLLPLYSLDQRHYHGRMEDDVSESDYPCWLCVRVGGAVWVWVWVWVGMCGDVNVRRACLWVCSSDGATGKLNRVASGLLVCEEQRGTMVLWSYG